MKTIVKKNLDKINLLKLLPLLIFAVFILLPESILAQATTAMPDESSIWSNTTFLILTSAIIFLLILIVVLGGVLKDLGSLFKIKDNSSLFKTIATFILLGSAVTPASAATGSYGGITPFAFYLLIAIILFEVIIIAVMINLIHLFLKKEKQKEKTTPKEFNLFDRISASVPIEKEGEIMFDHEYDGIRELDNDLPPWWKYGFYITIVVAVIYMVHYHITGTGALQGEEYTNEVKMADIKMAEYRAKAANLVDETNVTLLTDAASLEKGKVFYENCYACHGKLGEGGVGPNLTDDYWLYGGDIKNIFKIIKYGTEKGMKSWKEDFSPIQMSQLASYVITLHGTNPPNAKEPQGDLYKQGQPDSTSVVVKDTVAVTAVADSLK